MFHNHIQTNDSLRSWRSCEKAENPMRRFRFLAPCWTNAKKGEKPEGRGVGEKTRMTDHSCSLPHPLPSNFSPLFEFVQHGARNQIRLIGFSAFSQDRQLCRLNKIMIKYSHFRLLKIKTYLNIALEGRLSIFYIALNPWLDRGLVQGSFYRTWQSYKQHI